MIDGQSSSLGSGTAQVSALRKNDLILLSAILAEQYISEGSVWDHIQNDMLKILEHEERTYSQHQR